MLNWPDEAVSDTDAVNQWHQVGSNLCLDFHGDPVNAGICVLSDGNHHMALNEVIAEYVADKPPEATVFYSTVPPFVNSLILRDRQLRIGNLVLSIRPDILIGPPQFFDKLDAGQGFGQAKHLAQGRGCMLLVSKGNPKGIRSILDLARNDVRLFISNPKTEGVSYQGYADALRRVAKALGVNDGFLDPEGGRLMYGECIHHREAPTAVADGKVDVAVVYTHLALRYCRIFPDLFERIELAPEDAERDLSSAADRSRILVALNQDAAPSAQTFFDYLDSQRVTEIYTYHGLDRDDAPMSIAY